MDAETTSAGDLGNEGRKGASFALGTVQLGLPYGAANVTGMPSEEQAVAIVCEAVAAGVQSLDTAHGYELSQKRLGIAMKELESRGLSLPQVVTKLDTSMSSAKSAEELTKIVNASVDNSKKQLGLNPLHVVCLHTWEGHGPSLHGGAAYTRLKELKAQGAIKKIGTSTYFPSDVIEALKDPATDHIQLPFNLIDYRWRQANIAEALAGRPDVTVHARSCFLQGILVAPNTNCWPARFGREIAVAILGAIQELVVEFGRKNKADLCLAYARAQPWITEVLVGAETIEQLQELLELRSTPPLTPEQVTRVESIIPMAHPELLNPAKWHDKPSFAGSYATGLLGPEDA